MFAPQGGFLTMISVTQVACYFLSLVEPAFLLLKVTQTLFVCFLMRLLIILGGSSVTPVCHLVLPAYLCRLLRPCFPAPRGYPLLLDYTWSFAEIVLTFLPAPGGYWSFACLLPGVQVLLAYFQRSFGHCLPSPKGSSQSLLFLKGQVTICQ